MYVTIIIMKRSCINVGSWQKSKTFQRKLFQLWTCCDAVGNSKMYWYEKHFELNFHVFLNRVEKIVHLLMSTTQSKLPLFVNSKEAIYKDHRAWSPQDRDVRTPHLQSLKLYSPMTMPRLSIDTMYSGFHKTDDVTKNTQCYDLTVPVFGVVSVYGVA